MALKLGMKLLLKWAGVDPTFGKQAGACSSPSAAGALGCGASDPI